MDVYLPYFIVSNERAPKQSFIRHADFPAKTKIRILAETIKISLDGVIAAREKTPSATVPVIN